MHRYKRAIMKAFVCCTKSVLTLSLLLMPLAPIHAAEEGQTPPQLPPSLFGTGTVAPSDTVNCFDYYRFGSV